MNDNEAEVKNAAIINISDCLPNLSSEKIINLMLPTLQNNYVDGTSQFKAGVARALCDMASIIGKEMTVSKIIPILMDLIKDDNSEVKLNVIGGLKKIAHVVNADTLLSPGNIVIISNLTKDGQWRVRMQVFELIAELGIIFGKDLFQKALQETFMSYLWNTADSVR